MTSTVTDFQAFHEAIVSARLETPIGRMAARDVAGLPPLAFTLVGGPAYRLEPSGGTLRAVPGDNAPTVIELDEAAWRDFASEMATAAGLHYGRRIRFLHGDFATLERWEPALRALFCGRPIFDPDTDDLPPEFAPTRSFTTDERDDTLCRQLHAAGYLHLRRVFGSDEITRIGEVVEAGRAAARPGDGRSWWATRANGERVVCRLIYLGLTEPTIAALADDPRVRRLMSLAGTPLRATTDRSDGQSVVIKHADAREGLSDLPWHRDCGLGGHPVTCPAINIGIQLDAATEATGRLHFVPGSWRASCHRHDLARARTVAVDTEAGDVTAHFGDVMHAAPPPTGSGPGRRVLYVSCMPPAAYDVIPPGKSYNDVILDRVGS